ncbi:MAG: cadherin-like domain-containing protein, partial [Acidimicrobiaceae bacterium]|nr:cadherin-like domain-containing protein [Acidimicrobiaceae bacterium]
PGGGGGGGGYFGGGAGGEGATDGNGNLAGSGGGGGGASFMAGSGISSGGAIDTGNAGNINSGNGEAVFSWTDPISGGTPSYTTTEAEALSVPASAGLLSSTEGTSAPAGDPLTASGPVGGATAQGGTVTVHADGSFTYTPPSAFSGADSFTFTISDPSGDSATGTATIGVKAATPAQLTAALLQAVQRVGPGHSLADKVTRAQAYLASGDIAGTCSVFGSFTNEVEAQTGKHIPRATAGQVITLTQEIQTVLGC